LSASPEQIKGAADRAPGAIVSGANPIPRHARDRSGSGDIGRATDQPVRADRPILIERARYRTQRSDAGVDGNARDRRKAAVGVPLCGSPSDQECLGEQQPVSGQRKARTADDPAAGWLYRNCDIVDDDIMQVICPTCQI
jgi:hypothetical protein